jgi:hypothetical protein
LLNNEQLQRFAELDQLIEQKEQEKKELEREYARLEQVITLECMSAETLNFEIADLGKFKIVGGTDAVRFGILAQNREPLLKRLFPSPEEQVSFAASQINAKTVGAQLKEKLKKDFNTYPEVTLFFYHKLKFTPIKRKAVI